MKRVPLVDRSRPASLAPRVPPSMRVADGIGARTDSLENVLTGLGTSADKMKGTTFTFNEMNKAQLEMAFRSDWIARKCITIPPADATRQWRAWQADPKDIKLIEETEKNLKVQSKLRSAMAKARLYGGAALLLGTDDTQKMDAPLDTTKVKKDGLKFLHVVTKWDLSAGEIDWDLGSPNYGLPKYYMRAGGDGSRIDPSRVIRFIGNEVPDITLTQGWGDSILQVVQDAIIAAGMTCAAGAQLMQELKMDVVSIPELTDSLSNKAYEQRLIRRFGLASQTKSLYNVMLLDTDEKWERITANMTGLPDTLRMYLLIASGAVDIPATRFLGQSPAGLSATGESDTRNYYDHVKSEQTVTLQPEIAPLDECIIRSALGTGTPEDTTYNWNPLWQMDEKDEATIATGKANAFKIDVDAALIPSEVLRDARISQLIEDDTYPGLQQILEEYGPLDPIDDNPEPGSVVGPNGETIPPSDPRHPDQQQAPAEPELGPDGKPIPPKPKPASPFGDMASRIRRANMRNRKYQAMDGVMRTLYVSRPVLNAKDILAWAKQEGIKNLLPGSELHVTLCYSRTPLDWSKTGEAYGQDEDGTMAIKPGGMRVVQKFGNAIVLCFNSSELSWRNCSLRETAGATWDYADYQPHVTVAYVEPDDEPVDVEGITAYQGEIKLGPEIFAEATLNYAADADGNPYFADFNEEHGPDGKFGSTGGSGGSKEGGQGSKGGRVQAAKEAVKKLASSEGVKSAVKSAVGKVAANKMALINSAVQFGLYHGAGIDYGPDLEKAIGHEIEHLAENAKVATGKAKEWMGKAASAVKSYAAKGRTSDSLLTDSDANDLIQAAANMIKAVEAYEPDDEGE